MVLWIVIPLSLSLVSFIGTWTVYGLALSNNHVCSLSDWGFNNCSGNWSTECCLPPTISSSGARAPENSLFTATINAASFLSMGAFAAGNCNPGYLKLLHHLGAAISFICICFYTVLLTVLTGKCVLTGFEKFLYPLRITSTVIQTIVTICYSVLFAQDRYFYIHLSAVFEWMLSVNLELFELSYVVEFCFFSSFMLSNLLNKREEEKPLIIKMSG
ncbi:transmembrane protein 150A isoform X2 [Scophthalmus maximus]|uniref:transmembrane protein 150A isoform X2 n=1 Tax=Scophthalmus maximus TaxID=52904 RepID=UPI0015E0CA20|nr:transmembrane protein 150A isoform X2 [Scophthalmus maximus]